MGVRSSGRTDRSLTRVRSLVVAACFALLVAALLQPSQAAALPPPWNDFVFDTSVAEQTGPEVMVYDWSVQKCQDNDIPDTPHRAFKDNTGKVQLLSTHFENYRNLAQTTLDSPYTHSCAKLMTTTNSPDVSTYDSREWISSPWTADGQTVYALVHNEYQGSQFLPNCENYAYQCWWNSITSAVSTDGGATYTNTGPGHAVATLPWQLTKNGPHGYFTPSNIVRSGDGWFYAMIRARVTPGTRRSRLSNRWARA